MRILPSATVALAVAGFFGFSSNGAKAALVFDLTYDHCTGGCSTGVTPFGTVSITQSGVSGAYTDAFTVTLNSPYAFNGNGNGLDAFSFSLASGAGQAVTLTGASALSGSGFAITAANQLPAKQDGFGSYAYAINYGGTGATLLTFNVADDGINPLSLSSFLAGVPNGNGSVNDPSFFTADIVGKSGNTGAVGSGITTAVPEPSTWAMLILGFAGVGFMAYRRKGHGPALRLV